MKKSLCPRFLAPAFVLAIAMGAAQGATITVTTTDNTSPAGLYQALAAATNGDTIKFNIPGTGPHYIVTPVGGYPILTNLTGVTIDGYSQPGSSPNNHTILSSNNANITIYLASTNGECTDLTGLNGYDGEGAILSVFGCTNVVIDGLGLLGINPGGIANNSDTMYGIAAAGGDQPTDNLHIWGCRFGLDADGATVQQLSKDIVSYGARSARVLNIGVAPGSANPRAEFNVFIGGYIIYDVGPSPGGCLIRVSGNFLNVYPDGLHDFNIDGLTHDGVDHIVEALYEYGSTGTNSVFGTDGDGVNDAEERNIVGGVTEANDSNVWEAYGDGPRGMRISGNYFAVGIDGTTRFSNGGPDMEWLNIHKRGPGDSMQIGSDFDGVSDDVEGNLIFWNNPFSTLYGNPVIPGPGQNADHWAFLVGPDGDNGHVPDYISMRGNVLVNNLMVPWMYPANGTLTSDNFAAYESPFMDLSAYYLSGNNPQELIPQLSASTTAADIIGTCPLPATNGFTNIFIDVYVLDPEGWTNGIAFTLPELTDFSTYTNGFPAGRQFLGTFEDNGPLDRDPAVGRFNFSAAALKLTPGTQVTISANYSKDPAGTHNGHTHTSNFSNPTTLRAPIVITSFSKQGTTLTVNWTGGNGPFSLQRKSPVTGAWSTVQSNLPGPSTTYTDSAGQDQAYYRILGN